MLTPCIWMNGTVEEAARLYVATFPHAELGAISRYGEGGFMPAGTPMTVQLRLAGQPFTLLNGGPYFTLNPSISFFFHAEDAEQAGRVFHALAEGGKVLMPFGEWPWSPAFGWVQDRFGVSWQVMTGAVPGPLFVPCLMFSGAREGQAQAALETYARIFPEGRVEALMPYTAEESPKGGIKHGRARLDGSSLVAMDSPIDHGFDFNEAVSFQVACADQQSLDHMWNSLTADGGAESRCGWLKDRFGVSWQILPARLDAWMSGPNAGAVMQALMPMNKLDIATLARAAGEG